MSKRTDLITALDNADIAYTIDETKRDTMNTRQTMIATLEPRMAYMDAGMAVMRTIQAVGRESLPRNAREMQFAATDYLDETSAPSADGLVDAMLTAPRRAEWPA